MERQTLLDSLVEQVEKSKSFQNIMADGKVTDSEVMALADRINVLIAQVEKKLSDEDFKLVSELLSELAVLYTITKFNEKVR